MSHFEQLEPDHRIVLRMAVRRRRSYAAMAGALDTTPEEIRRRAYDALDALAPEHRADLPDEQRHRTADFLLGQLSEPAQETTARSLAREGPARAWALLVQERLGDLGDPVVEIPTVAASPPSDAGSGAAADPRTERPRPGGGGAHAPRVRSALSGAAATGRRALGTGPGKLAAGALALVLLLIVLLVAGVFGGGGGGSEERAAVPEPTDDQVLAARFVAAMPPSIRFSVPAGAPAEFASASAVARPTVSSDDPAVPVLALEIEGLPAPSATRNYFAWADRGGQDPVLLGALPAASGAQLPFAGIDVGTRQQVQVDPTVYDRVRVTAETTDGPTGPGRTVLVGTLSSSFEG